MNQTKKKNPLKRLLSMRGMGQVVTVTIGLIVLLVAFALINPNFWSPTNRTNLLRQIAPILIIGIAQSYVLITGNIDLSIGSVVGMSTMVAATLMSKGIMSPIPALLVTLLCCLLIGVLNGLLVAKFKLPPFIATLGTMTVARGIAQLVNGNYNTDSIMKFYPEAAQTFKNVFYYGKTLGLYNGIWIAIILWIVFNFLLSKTRTGRYIYATGSNIDAARLSGVNVVSTTVIAHSARLLLVSSPAQPLARARWMPATPMKCMPLRLLSSAAFPRSAVRASCLALWLARPSGAHFRTAFSLPAHRSRSATSLSALLLCCLF